MSKRTKNSKRPRLQTTVESDLTSSNQYIHSSHTSTRTRQLVTSAGLVLSEPTNQTIPTYPTIESLPGIEIDSDLSDLNPVTNEQDLPAGIEVLPKRERYVNSVRIMSWSAWGSKDQDLKFYKNFTGHSLAHMEEVSRWLPRFMPRFGRTRSFSQLLCQSKVWQWDAWYSQFSLLRLLRICNGMQTVYCIGTPHPSTPSNWGKRRNSTIHAKINNAGHRNGKPLSFNQ